MPLFDGNPTDPLVTPGALPSPTPSPRKRMLKIVWYVVLGITVIGALGEASHRDISGFWLVALFGLPTLWLFKGLGTRVKIAVTGAFAFVFICFAIFSITPPGKAANASFKNQEAHDAQVAAQKKQQKEARDAERQAQEDKAEAQKKALEDKEQAKQDEAQKAQDAVNESRQAKDEQKSAYSKANAYSAAQQFVTGHLKSPGSAKYPDFDEEYVQLTGNNTYSVSAYVDSQNSFGALIRTSWQTTVRNDGDGNWRCDGVSITGSTD